MFFVINFIAINIGSEKSLQNNRISSVFIAIISPVQKSVSSTFDFVQNIWETYFLTINKIKENTILKKKLEKIIINQNRFKELELENMRLKKILNFTTSSPATYASARIIARDPSSWYKTIMIDKGKNDNIVKGSPVVTAEGIVGQVIKVSKNYAQVILLIDRNTSVDGLIQDSRVNGIVQGNNTSNCFFNYVPKQNEIKQGEIIVSSGLDRIFPKGLKIGSVLNFKKSRSQLFWQITIKPSVDFDTIEEVLVLKQQ